MPRWVIALLMCAVLAQPLSTLFAPSFGAWSLDHTHITLGGVVPPHTHPYDRTKPGWELLCGVTTSTPASAAAAGDRATKRVVSQSSSVGIADEVMIPATEQLIPCFAGQAVVWMAVPVVPEMVGYRPPLPPPRNMAV